jgi:hypothetical protein
MRTNFRVVTILAVVSLAAVVLAISSSIVSAIDAQKTGASHPTPSYSNSQNRNEKSNATITMTTPGSILIPTLTVSATCDIHNPNYFNLVVLPEGFPAKKVTYGMMYTTNTTAGLRGAAVSSEAFVNEPARIHVEYAEGQRIPGSKHAVIAQVGPDKYGSFDPAAPHADAILVVPEPCPLTLPHATENILNRIFAYNLTKESGYDLDTKLEAAIAALNNNQTLIAKEKLISFIDEMTKNSERVNSISPLAPHPLEKQFIDAARDIVKAIDLKQSTVQFRWVVG